MSSEKEVEASDNIFTIDCKDIMLREFRLEDLDKLHALTLQPEITDVLPDWIGTKEQHKDWLINMYLKRYMNNIQIGEREFYHYTLSKIEWQKYSYVNRHV